jgi:hypothetical protein
MLRGRRIDDFVTEFFAQEPVLTGLDFVVALNGMIYALKKMSIELLRFATVLRELHVREKGSSVTEAVPPTKDLFELSVR